MKKVRKYVVYTKNQNGFMFWTGDVGRPLRFYPIMVRQYSKLERAVDEAKRANKVALKENWDLIFLVMDTDDELIRDVTPEILDQREKDKIKLES